MSDAQTGPDSLRLSDAERETASQALGEHFAQGRLDADEHAERHERVWTAKTRGEIPPLFADLPGGSPLHPAPRPQPGPPRPRPRRGSRRRATPGPVAWASRSRSRSRSASWSPCS